MGNGKTTMFSTLLCYYDEAYYQEHPIIHYDTVYGSGDWQIFAAFMYDVTQIEAYNYTQHDFATEKDFNRFVSKAKELTTYQTGVDVKYGDHILTLSTCDRAKYGKNGRCVIMAKFIQGSLFPES